MKTKSILYMLLVVAFLSCSEESGNFPDAPKKDRYELTMKLKLQESVETRQVQAHIYDDSEIVEIDVIVFKYKRYEDDRFYEHVRIPNSDIEVDPTTGFAKTVVFKMTFDPDLVAYPKGGAKIMVYINSRKYLEDFIQNYPVTTSTTRDEFHDFVTMDYKYQGAGKPLFDYVPMEGNFPVIIFDHIDSSNLGEMAVLKSLNRVDIGVDLENKNWNNIRNNFKINRVWVLGNHGSQRISVAKDNVYGNKTDPHVLDTDMRYVDVRLYWDFPADNKLESCIYIPESKGIETTGTYPLTMIDKHGISTKYPNADAATYPFKGTFLVVEATKDGVPGHFYRIDFGARNTFYHAVRHRRFVVNIAKVYNDGYSTLEDAMMSPPRIRTRSNQSDLEVEITGLPH